MNRLAFITSMDGSIVTKRVRKRCRNISDILR